MAEAAAAASGAETATGAPEGTGAAAAAPAESAPQTPPEPKTWKLGNRVITDPDELYAYAAQSAAERDYIERAQSESQKAQAFMERLRTNPREALADPAIGHDMLQRSPDSWSGIAALAEPRGKSTA